MPVFDTVADAVAGTGANTSMIFVPARFAADAIYEAVDAGIGTVICITEGLPGARHAPRLQLHPPARRDDVGPNCPGVLSPGKANVGIIPAEVFSEGSIGLVSRSGTLTYQIGHELTHSGSATRRSPASAATRSSARPSSTSSSGSRPIRRPRSSSWSARSAATRRRRPPGSSPRTCRSRSSPTSPASAPRPGRRWATRARSSPARRHCRGEEGSLEASGVRVGTSPTEAAQLAAEIAKK